MRTIDKIITPVNGKFGAPMGRSNIGVRPNKRIYDCFVPLDNGGYDRGGAYWGLAIHGTKPLRVAYTKDLSYVEFYRAFERKA
jgi:hypothetical protein